MSYIQGPVLPGGFTGFANPSTSVGLTAVNGTATTAMRSDGAPPLDVTIAPTWTGAHAWSLAANSTPITATGSNTGSNAASGLTLNWTLNTSGSPDVFKLAVTDTARGAATKLVNIYAGASGTTSEFSIDRSGNVIAAGSASFSNSGIQIRTLGGNGFYTSGGGFLIWEAASVLSLYDSAGTSVVKLTPVANAILQLGAANAASPVAQTLQAQGSRAGTDASTAGANLTIQPGIGTGNSGKSSLILNGIIGTTTSTTTAQTTAAGATIPGVASGQLPGLVIGSGAIATTATDGFLYIAGGAGVPAGTPTAFTGRYPLYWDTTNKKLYVYDGSWLGGISPGVFV